MEKKFYIIFTKKYFKIRVEKNFIHTLDENSNKFFCTHLITRTFG